MQTPRPSFGFHPPGGSTPGPGKPGDDRVRTKPGRPDPKPYPGGGGDDNGNGDGNGNGNNGDNDGGDNDNGQDDDDDDTIIIYCWHCGCPWWDCWWGSYWSPMYWHYHWYDSYFWDTCWTPAWRTVYVEYHTRYDFVDTYPSIYTAPALLTDPNSQSIAYLDEGAALFREGNYHEALARFRLAALADLGFGVPKFAYAQALFALGIYDHAAYQIRLGLSLMPEWPRLGGDLRMMYGKPEDFDVQLKALMAHLRVWPGDEDALTVLGYVSFFTGDLYVAQKAFEKLSHSATAETARLAQLFLDEIATIKQDLSQSDTLGAAAADDGLTIGDVLGR